MSTTRPRPLTRRDVLATVGVAGAIAAVPTAVIADGDARQQLSCRKRVRLESKGEANGENKQATIDAKKELITIKSVEAGSPEHQEAVRNGFTCTPLKQRKLK